MIPCHNVTHDIVTVTRTGHRTQAGTWEIEGTLALGRMQRNLNGPQKPQGIGCSKYKLYNNRKTQ